MAEFSTVASHLAEESSKMEALNLSCNTITDAGVLHLAKAVSALDRCCCWLHTEGIGARHLPCF